MNPTPRGLDGILLCTVLFAGPTVARVHAQEEKPARPAPTDWAAVVAKAHTHRRLMVRRAAAQKVARAGDAAVPAIRAFEKKHGSDAIRLEFVDAFARARSHGPATLALLERWARDREFFWRSQALQALANRRLPRFRGLFVESLDDGSYLTRIQAGRGLCLLGVERDKVNALLRDPDPRARMRVAICLAEEGDDYGLPPLVAALRQEAAFLDYLWGRLGANLAFKALRKAAGTDYGFAVGETVAKNESAIAKFAAFARERLGKRWVDPIPAFHDTGTYRGGIAIRSCRNGDLFVRFGADRRVVYGLEADANVTLPEAAWTKLWQQAPCRGSGVHGKVVCDYLRLMSQEPTADEKFAPGALPEKTSEWLQALAMAIEKNGRQDLAQRITDRLPQFTARRTH